MEISNIDSAPIRIGDLRNAYGNAIPEEFYMLKEDQANLSVLNEIKQLAGDDNKILEQLEKDCNLDNLFYEGEYSTLEEILKIIPMCESSEKSFKTLDYLKKEVGNLSWRNSILNSLQRAPRPFYDMSYKNSIDESPEATEINKDLFVTVYVYRPFCMPYIDSCCGARRLVVSQRLVLLSKQNLGDLRDAIKCPQDKIWLGDCSEALDKTELHVCADKLYTSSYFFIEGTFYDDLRNPANIRLSEPIIEWAKKKTEFKSQGTLNLSSMESTLLESLTVHLGKPYYFVHQGNCEHMIIFSDIRLIDRDSCQSKDLFPMLTGRCAIRILHCFACKRLACRWLVSNCKILLPIDPCPLCDVCIRHLLYTSDGKKIDPEFRVQMYCGDEILI